MATTNTIGGSSSAHILLYPLPASGHIIPFLELTHKLLTRGLTITVVVTAENLHLLDPILSRHPQSQIQPLVLPVYVKLHTWPATLRSVHDQHYPLLRDWFLSCTSPPAAIISDLFLGWTQSLATQFGTKRIVFSTNGALAFSILTSKWSNLPRNENPQDEDFILSFYDIPNSPAFPWWQVSLSYRMYKEGDPDSEFFRKSIMANLASWGIVFNSFTQLERIFIDHIRQMVGRVWAVGPLLLQDDGGGDSKEPATTTNTRGGFSTVPCEKVMSWLDNHKDNSVVYICFGSLVMLNAKQMVVLTAALEKSNVSFVWCMRQPSTGGQQASTEYSALPDDFEDRVAGRGFIIKGWGPQLAILRHRAVGAFLTHCGWNSSLEGLSAGVVFLAWPMLVDQFGNAMLVVDELGVGVRVGGGDREIPMPDELAKALEESTEMAMPERVKAKRLQEAAASAVRGGTSNRDLDDLVVKLNDFLNQSDQ